MSLLCKVSKVLLMLFVLHRCRLGGKCCPWPVSESARLPWWVLMLTMWGCASGQRHLQKFQTRWMLILMQKLGSVMGRKEKLWVEDPSPTTFMTGEFCLCVGSFRCPEPPAFFSDQGPYSQRISFKSIYIQSKAFTSMIGWFVVGVCYRLQHE